MCIWERIFNLHMRAIMKYFKIITIIATSLILSGCVDPNTIEVTTTPTTSMSVFTEAKRLAADRMRDPEATRFKSEHTAYRTSAGDTVVCGTMNAKNAMGGYVGYKPFYMRIRDGVVESFLLPSEDEFATYDLQHIIKVCADASNGTQMVST